ncbi:hypothetical protein [Peterkaempfera griseoplana]|uniref:hypothetical protein n=1 Tax=Peterkaempfera griseoplana TaxID=66896 RepID=UPI0006E203EE|nr:hypothetical protein [Peterkaempfera griseoplana]
MRSVGAAVAAFFRKVSTRRRRRGEWHDPAAGERHARSRYLPLADHYRPTPGSLPPPGGLG